MQIYNQYFVFRAIVNVPPVIIVIIISSTSSGGAAVAQSYSVWLLAGRSGFDPLQGQRIFLLAPASRPALEPTKPPIQWVPGVLSPGAKRGRGVTLTTHPHLVAKVEYE
jgi:hypothetical protein